MPRRVVASRQALAASARRAAASSPECRPTPQHLLAAYEDMLRVRVLRPAPRLVFATSAFNTGGFFTPEPPGLIVVGEKDSEQIAEGIWATRRDEVVAEMQRHAALHRKRLESPWEFLLLSVRGRILAHELGHALRHAGVRTPYRDEEAAADYLAGYLDGRRGRNLRLGEILFWTIGCEGPWCAHPMPNERLTAYRRGYQASGQSLRPAA